MSTTSGQLAKFDPRGNVTDSIITETGGGSIGIGTRAPSVRTQIEGTNDEAATLALRRSDNNKFMRLGVGTQGVALDFDSTSFLVIQKNTLGVDGVLAGQELLRVTSNGNVGIGTPSPVTSLHVAGNLALDSGTSPVLYTGTGNSEQNRYLQLINSPAFTSASGLKAGGILIADGYDFANPGKNDLIVKGNVGIGTPLPFTPPVARLTVETSGPDSGDFTFAAGVVGSATNRTGVPGLWRETAGVRGINDDGHGVQGQSLSHVGVEGKSISGTGVFGQCDSGTAVGGITTSGVAGFFRGPVQVVGALSKSGGGFRIDHPMDSANKYLNHSFVESPEMKNVYDGVAVLDANGEAAVMLPDWFEALNEGFRYQLTPVGAPAPQLHVADEIADAQFRIAGGVPGQRVCWQVTGVRKDPWARAYPVVVEEPKIDDERGHYLNPELFGQGEDQSIMAARYPNVRRGQT
jgi:hypothetical protein